MGCQLKQQGLTLIEVMVAIFILSIVMVGVVLSSSQVMRSTQRLHDRLMALWVSQAVGVELRSGALGKISIQMSISGEQQMGQKTWRWVGKAQPEEDIVRVVIDVFEEGHAESLLTQSYYVSLP